ncbi:MAG: Amuc_1100 family pilus-like protein [Puniceicoccales bacterium]|jgi:hypothetical protein|nr:Amuc_1100 family pilus-like protein [Puniceicoccales bacterium]
MTLSEQKKGRIVALMSAVSALIFIPLLFIFHGLALQKKKFIRERDGLQSEMIVLVRQAGLKSDHSLAARAKVVDQLAIQAQQLSAEYNWKSIEKLPEVIPSNGELYFTLVQAMQAIEKEAEACAVALPNGPLFGFCDIIRSGKIMDFTVGKMWTQMREIQTLLSLLFSCSKNDLQFLSLSRESSDPREFSRYANDLFDGRQIVNLRSSLGGTTHCYRLKFRCHGQTFRNFLNGLSQHSLPVIIQSMTVKGNNLIKNRSGMDDGKIGDIVVPKPAEYVLVFEWLHLGFKNNP